MFSVDVSKVVAHSERGAGLHRAFAQQVPVRLRRARDLERRTHAYQNRTGNLQRSTQVIRSSGSGLDVSWWLIMGMVYASYVERRGFTDFKQIADGVKAELDEMQRRTAERTVGA